MEIRNTSEWMKILLNISNRTESIENLSKQIVDDFLKLVTPYMNDSMNRILDANERYEQMKQNPYSYYNEKRYQKILKDFYWAFPYQITHGKLLSLSKTVKNEEEFDLAMLDYFTNDIIRSLIIDLKSEFSDDHFILLEQIECAFKNESYALSSLGLITLLDVELSFFLKNKKETRRKQIFKPILEDLMGVYPDPEEYFNVYILSILAHNIDELFKNNNQKNESNQKDKQVNRHLFAHGKKYSNSRKECVMLMNTLYNVTYIKKCFPRYQNKVKYKKVDKIYIPLLIE